MMMMMITRNDDEENDDDDDECDVNLWVIHFPICQDLAVDLTATDKNLDCIVMPSPS